MCARKAAVLQQSVALLGEHQRVQTESVSAERRLAEVRRELNFPQAGALQRFAHFLDTAEERRHFLVRLNAAFEAIRSQVLHLADHLTRL